MNRTSRGALTTGLIVAAHAVVATIAVGALVAVISTTPRGMVTAAAVVQASGIVALVWAYAGLVLGLLVGIRPLAAVRRPAGREVGSSRQIGRSVVLSLHRQLNLVVLALVLLHAVVFAVGTPGGSLLVAFVPGIPGPQSLGYTLGVLAFYLALVVGPSYYFRDRIGRRTWLIAHQLAALSYAIALWHAIGLGPEMRMSGVGRTLTWSLQIPLLILIAARLLWPRRPADQLSPVLRRGRYGGPRHTRMRAAIAVGLVTSGVVILLMALLAVSGGADVNG